MPFENLADCQGSIGSPVHSTWSYCAEMITSNSFFQAKKEQIVEPYEALDKREPEWNSIGRRYVPTNRAWGTERVSVRSSLIFNLRLMASKSCLTVGTQCNHYHNCVNLSSLPLGVQQRVSWFSRRHWNGVGFWARGCGLSNKNVNGLAQERVRNTHRKNGELEEETMI